MKLSVKLQGGRGMAVKWGVLGTAGIAMLSLSG